MLYYNLLVFDILEKLKIPSDNINIDIISINPILPYYTKNLSYCDMTA